jgi:hypothetical protein
VVFVEDAAEDASSPYGPVDLHDNVRVVVGWTLIETLMWAVTVEMSLVGSQYGAGVLFVVDQDMVGALPPYAADEPFRIAVRPRRAGRDLHDVHAFGLEHRVERRGEPRVPVADKEPERRRPITQVHDQVAGLPGWFGYVQ